MIDFERLSLDDEGDPSFSAGEDVESVRERKFVVTCCDSAK